MAGPRFLLPLLCAPDELAELRNMIENRLAQMTVRDREDVRVHALLSRMRGRIAGLMAPAQPETPEGTHGKETR
jgi:hypothetical protein